MSLAELYKRSIPPFAQIVLKVPITSRGFIELKWSVGGTLTKRETNWSLSKSGCQTAERPPWKGSRKALRFWLLMNYKNAWWSLWNSRIGWPLSSFKASINSVFLTSLCQDFIIMQPIANCWRCGLEYWPQSSASFFKCMLTLAFWTMRFQGIGVLHWSLLASLYNFSMWSCGVWYASCCHSQ